MTETKEFLPRGYTAQNESVGPRSFPLPTVYSNLIRLNLIFRFSTSSGNGRKHDGVRLGCKFKRCSLHCSNSAALMPDVPENRPELIATLRVGSVISGECSVCHEVVVVKGLGIEAPGKLEHMIEHAFAGHVCSVHSPDSQGNRECRWPLRRGEERFASPEVFW